MDDSGDDAKRNSITMSDSIRDERCGATSDSHAKIGSDSHVENESDVPPGLANWLAERRQAIISCRPLRGTYAGRLFRLFVEPEVGGPRLDPVTDGLVYKQLDPDRAQEFHIYPWLSEALPSYVLRPVAQICHAGEQGILLPDGGRPLKSTIRADDGRCKHVDRLHDDCLGQVVQAAGWLAEMHVRYEELAKTWRREGRIQSYAVASSAEWGAEAVKALDSLQKRGLCNVTQGDADFVTSLAGKVLMWLPKSLEGRATLVHGDPHLENILISETGQMRLIDWEYLSQAVPQRDFTVFLQDILDEEGFQAAYDAYLGKLADGGWDVLSDAFVEGFHVAMLDNTLMMLGWEVRKFDDGSVTLAELEEIVAIKLKWLKKHSAALCGQRG